MPRHEQSGERDLTINLWHRAVFDDHAKGLDIDFQGRCYGCDQPLYVFEATRSANYKATKWLVDTAVKLNVPAYLIWYAPRQIEYCETCGRPKVALSFDKRNIVDSEVFRIVPYVGRQFIGDLDYLEAHLKELRVLHQKVWHPDRPA